MKPVQDTPRRATTVHDHQSFDQLELPERLLKAVDRLRLTRRESELAILVALGWSTPDICSFLGISSATMRTHLRNVYAALGITGRAQLVARVIKGVLEDIEP